MDWKNLSSVDFEGLGKKVAAGLAILTAVFTLIGAKEGTLTRVIRNNPTAFFVGLSFALVGIVVAYLLDAGLTKEKFVFTLIPLAIFIAGLVVMTNAAIDTTAALQRPQIKASLKTSETGVVTLDGEATASGLRNDQHLLLEVFGENPITFPASSSGSQESLPSGNAGQASTSEPPSASGPPSGPSNTATLPTLSASFSQAPRPRPRPLPEPGTAPPPPQFLLGSRAGPDQDGNVTRPFTVPIDPGVFRRVTVLAIVEDPPEDFISTQDLSTKPADETEKEGCPGSQHWGCLSLWLPHVPVRPEISSTFKAGSQGANEGGTVSVSISSEDLGADDIVRLWITTRSTGSRSYRIQLTGTYVPNGAGRLSTTVEGVVPPRTRDICVTAVLSDPEEAQSGSMHPDQCRSMLRLPNATVDRIRLM
jgi:hypothetical protein